MNAGGSHTNSPAATRYITDAAGLQQCADILRHSTVFAFDLEFDRDRYTYGFDLCLMQVATPEVCFLIDPLGKIDLQPLFEVFTLPQIRKLVHCPGEDLRLLHSLQCYPVNLVDTEVMAKLLNYEQTSLSNMLLLHCGISIDKKLQTSNWGRRPLSDAQLQYAASDVIYLFELEKKLLALVEEKKVQWAVEAEMLHLNSLRFNLEDRQDFLKKNDRVFMSPYDQYVLNELFRWRDQLARQKNKPAHQIMAEEVLRQVAYGKLPAAQVPAQHGVHPVLKSGEMISKLEQSFKAFHAQAKASGLSRKRAGQGLTEEERMQLEKSKQETEAAKKQIFQPIQQHLCQQWGEHAARFLFSTTLVNDILRGAIRIGFMQPAYRSELVKQAAQHLAIDISPWW
jgi:ribonuclease D